MAVGAKSSIGTTAVALTASDVPLKFGIWIKAAAGNGGTVHVGFADTVTVGAADTTDGYTLSAGHEHFFPASEFTFGQANVNKVYVIGSTGTQKVFWHGY